MKRKKILCFILSISAILIALFAFSRPNVEPVSESTFLLDTIVTITLYGSEKKKLPLIEESFSLCQDYEQLLSRTLETSDINRINHRSPSESTLYVTPKTADLLRIGYQYSELSGGAFDITVGSLTSLWDFKASSPTLPSDSAIQSALSSIGYSSIHLADTQITLDHPNTQLDLGAIAKGYIADRIKEFLISKGETSGIINLGGNILCIGEKPDKTPYKIGIQKPFANRNETIATVEIRDMSMVSSGIYERYFVLNGKNYHHILNPHTGYPFETGLLSVTILSPLSVDGDALSTVCFSLGLTDGMNLINSFKDIYAVFITENGEIHYSENFPEIVVNEKTSS